MLQHQYEIKYIVQMHSGVFAYQNNPYSCSGLSVTSVYKLLDVTDKSIYQVKKNGDQILVIEPSKWKNIALTYVCERNTPELISGGAILMNKSQVFDTEIDAKIQLAFACAKHMVEQEHVYGFTQRQLTPESYGQLVEKFYDEFPEKFV